jgi:two-component system nitrate/nitrite response regulator NarL
MPDSSVDIIRIVLLDKFILERCGLRLLIESHPRLKIVGESGDGIEGLEIATRQKPDIVLLNSNLLVNRVDNIVPALIQSNNRGRIILLTTAEHSQLYIQAIHEGVLGVILKTQTPEVLYKAIEKVHAGEVWIERSMIANVLTSLSDTNKVRSAYPEAERISQLSNREHEVIRLIALGLKNQRIASELSISETTVRHHLTSIFSKLGVSDRLELLVYAHRNGLAQVAEPPTSSRL